MTAVPGFDLAALFDAEEYLHFLAPTLRDEDTPAQCGFIEQALSLAPGSRVLDLGCGHGRHANELARRGHRVVGIDLVEGFVARARAEAERERLPAEFVCGDMRAFQAAPEFDAAVCLFDAFGFHTDEEHARILANALAALRPGGQLLLDVRNREHMLRCPPVALVELDNGDMMIDRFHFDLEAGRMLDRRSYVRSTAQGLTRRDITFSVRLYAATELRALLQAAGWRVQRSYGGFDGVAASAALPRLLVVASKPASPWD
ncbi:MAG: class I SAM-dependent methyltransferase [Burkholderiales bacterium]|nr:class I SAM-dependent methyltransferase [Burkholderiales bacterium]